VEGELRYRPDSQEILSLARLARMLDGQTLTRVLDAELQVLTGLLIDANDEAQWRCLQGQAQAIKGLLELLKKVRESDAPL
jgi:hypothetical protein